MALPASEEWGLCSRNGRLIYVKAILFSKSHTAKSGQANFPAPIGVFNEKENPAILVHINGNLQFELSFRQSGDNADNQVFSADGILQICSFFPLRPRTAKQPHIPATIINDYFLGSILYDDLLPSVVNYIAAWNDGQIHHFLTIIWYHRGNSRWDSADTWWPIHLNALNQIKQNCVRYIMKT